MKPSEILDHLRRRIRCLDSQPPVMTWGTDATGRPAMVWVMPVPPDERFADWPADPPRAQPREHRAPRH